MASPSVLSMVMTLLKNFKIIKDNIQDRQMILNFEFIKKN